ncbi:conjugal transfer relaxosome DNA-binding protein TraM [Klebsiella pneumoniae]|uniref:conjugal transfer relaxosome DNA-binding protein TraM n=3 Tax=Klebsiella pneumoniae TaxID=573 RepID=UPI0023DCE6D2|nr:conjugal transfer relaxosome DNA-binding protein TraM [Klebsiella pneumoniae]MDF1985259.1 conjugal transfer relaxosome DNA-binding protein TraM [Klebsiella pneumoniae]
MISYQELVRTFLSDEVAEKINAIVEKRKAEGAREKDVSFSSVSTMLVELGLRVYEAQMERKESGFNQMAFNKILLETVLKTQFATNKILGISCLSPHISGNQKFEWRFMIDNILEDTKEVVDTFFPESEDGDEE